MHQPITETAIPVYQPPPSFWQKLRCRLIKLVIFASLLWCAAIIVIWYQQEALIFHPEAPGNDYSFNLDHTSEVYIDVPGAKLHALYLRQPAEKSRGIVLFLHGNAGNLKTWFTRTEFWVDTGYDVLMLDYRGFGKSTGRIESEAQLNDDVLRVWNFVAPNYAGKKRVIYGRSIGTGLAAKLAATVPADLLVLVSPYESIAKIAQEYYPWAPSFVLRYRLEIDKLLPQISTKTVLLHGTDDKLISIEHSRNLVKLKPDAQLIEVDGAGHGDIHDFDVYINTLSEILATL